MPSDSGITTVRRVAHSLLSHGLVIVSFCFVVLFWFRALTIEPFDSFESIHRVMATELKRSVDLVIGDTAYRAVEVSVGAVYSTLLANVSTIIDGENADVSAFSGRILSVFLSVFILWNLHSTWKILFNKSSYSSFEERRFFTTSLSPVFYTLLNIPVLAVSVLLSSDLLFLAFASFYICRQTVSIVSLLLARNEDFNSQVLIACSLAGVLAAHGWSGYLVLSLCPLLFAGSVWIYAHRWSAAQIPALFFKSLTGLFLRQSATGILFYFAFFLVFQRPSSIDLAALAHIGFTDLQSLLSLEGVLARAIQIGLFATLCFSYSTALIIYGYCIDSSKPDSVQESTLNRLHSRASSSLDQLLSLWFGSLAFGWLLCFLVLDGSVAALFFGCPVLSLWAVSLRARQSFFIVYKYRKYLIRVAHFLTFFLPTILLLVAISFLIQSQFQVSLLDVFLNKSLNVVMNAFSERGLYFGVSIFAAGALSLVSSAVVFYWASMCLKRRRKSALFLSGTVRLVVLFQTTAAVILLQCVVVEAEDIMTSSLQQSVDKAKLYLEPGEPLATAALFAPNVASFVGGSVEIRKDTAEDLFKERKYSVILTPDWNIGLCEKHGYDISAGAEFYRICLRSYKSTLEGPQN